MDNDTYKRLPLDLSDPICYTVHEVDALQALNEFAEDSGVLRSSWHEPDEVGVEAELVGDTLDTAFIRPFHRPTETTIGTSDIPVPDMHIHLKKDGETKLVLNLAVILSAASKALQ